MQHPASLLEYLFASWPDVKKKQIRSWLKHRAVIINGQVVSRYDHPLRAGDVVELQTNRQAAELRAARAHFAIHFDDDDLIVVEKPPNVLSVASEADRERTFYRQLTDALRERIWIVHRLDRETSGLMVFAKNVQTKRMLQTRWDEAEKRYQAIVVGNMETGEGTFESYLDESNPFRVFSVRASDDTRRAVTDYRVLARGGGRTLVELRLVTGRRHQIRVHLADAGHPVVGDAKYGSTSSSAKRLALHSCGLAFRHPKTGVLLTFDSLLPAELARLLHA